MSLSRVCLTPDVFSVCATHALSTESEEVMGLLLGDIMYDDRGESVAQVYVALPQIRADRRKDRVEASPEQLASAMAAGEKLSEESGMRVRVIGWYHSHPHITVLPSHVDVATQASYQQLDAGFIGIIFSTFNQDTAECMQQVQVTAFQSVQQESGLMSPPASGALDSPLARALAASAADARQRAAEGGQWVRREVPLAVQAQPQASRLFPNGLRKLLSVLFEEEHQAYSNAMESAADSFGAVDFLTAVHHSALCQQQMCRLLEVAAGPVLDALRARCWEAEVQVRQLSEAVKECEQAEAERRAAGRSQPQPTPVSYLDAPMEQPVLSTSPTEPSTNGATVPDSPEKFGGSSSAPQRVNIRLPVPHDAGEDSVWADAYNAGIAHVAPDSSASRQNAIAVSQTGDAPIAASSSPSSTKPSRPPYNPMQNQPLQSQQQQTAQQETFQSQTTLDSSSLVIHTHPPSDQQSSAGRDVQMQDGRAYSQPGSARSYDGSPGCSQAPEQHRMRQRNPTDPFSDLLHTDMTRRLSIHDQDLWSKLHREGDI